MTAPAKKLRSVTEGGEPITTEPEDEDDELEFEILGECPKHLLRSFDQDDKPSDVMEEAIELVVAENQALLAQGGFHEGLIFRDRTGQHFVTLVQDDEGHIVVDPITGHRWTMDLQKRFCFFAGSKKKAHKPLPAWFTGTMNGGEHRFRFPPLGAVLSHPAVRVDGSIVLTEGYDVETKSWVPAGWDNLKVPTKPTVAEVNKAIMVLREPMSEMIFDGDEVVGSAPVKKPGVDMTPSEANAIGAALTILMRRQMPEGPLFIPTSDSAATAKGTLTNLLTTAVTGGNAFLSVLPTSVDQMEKQIGRVLEDHPGARVIQFDEPTESGRSKVFYSRQLAVIVTAPDGEVTWRNVYGRKAVTLDVRRTMFFTGINVTPDRDLTRRVCVIRLGVPVDGTLPQERTFKHKDRANKALLLRWMAANRREYVRALLVLVANWKAKGCPKFEGVEFDLPEWVHTIGGIMHAAGITAWMENRYDVLAQADEASRVAFVLEVVATVGNGPFITRDLMRAIHLSARTDDLRDLVTWEGTWSDRLHRNWNDEAQASRALGRVLSELKNRWLTGPGGERVEVKSYQGHNNTIAWQFETPQQVVPAKPVGGRGKRRS